MNYQKLIAYAVKYLGVILPLFVTVISVAVMSQILFKNLFIEKSQTSYQEKYYLYLEKGLQNNLFDGIYAKTGFNYYDRASEGTLSRSGYIELLENFNVYLITSRSKKDSLFQVYYQKSTDLLSKAKVTEPFASLPNEERRLMDNIQIFIQRKDTLNTLQSLNELKQVILARHKEYQRIENQNSWTVPLAFVGIAFTLIFGIWSTIIGVRKYKNAISR